HRNDEGDVPVRPMNGKAIADEEPEPSEEVAPLPDPRGPLFLAVGCRLFCPFRGSGRGHSVVRWKPEGDSIPRSSAGQALPDSGHSVKADRPGKGSRPNSAGSS